MNYKLCVEYCESENKTCPYRWSIIDNETQSIINYGYSSDMLTSIDEGRNFCRQLQRSELLQKEGK